MLRNEQEKQEQEKCAILNEVLSLNAQEWNATSRNIQAKTLLNEVLSLNAQEFRPVRLARTTVSPQ